MKNLLVIIGLVSMTACSTAKPARVVMPTNPERASLQDCKDVYEHVLTLVAEHFWEAEHPESQMTPQQRVDEVNKVRQQSAKGGADVKFMTSCQKTANVNQTFCALHAADLDDLNACVRIFKTN